MATTFTLYSSFRKYVMNGTVNLESDTIKVALVTSSYTPDVSHDVLADVLGSPSCEVEAIASPSNGYTQGGNEVTGKTVSNTDSPSQGVFDGNNVSWAELTATFRYGIVYAQKSVSPVENPLIGWILFDDTPDDIVLSASNFTIQWNVAGIITS